MKSNTTPMKRLKWNIVYSENSGEYSGLLVVTANELHQDKENKNCFWADGVCVEFGEDIISVSLADHLDK